MAFATDLVALLVAASPPQHTVAPPEAGKDIVVTAEIPNTNREFIARMTDRYGSDQLPRWDGELCLRVNGVPPDQAQYITDRITEAARRVKVRVYRYGCRGDTVVSITNKATETAAALAAAPVFAFSTIDRTALSAFKTSTKPVRWFSTINLCPATGCAGPGSRLSLGTEPNFETMIVVVDAKQLSGVSVGALARYLSFVILSSPPLQNVGPDRSIISLFDHRGEVEHAVWTLQDENYIKGLYSSRHDGLGQEQRAWINEYMKKHSSP